MNAALWPALIRCAFWWSDASYLGSIAIIQLYCCVY